MCALPRDLDRCCSLLFPCPSAGASALRRRRFATRSPTNLSPQTNRCSFRRFFPLDEFPPTSDTQLERLFLSFRGADGADLSRRSVSRFDGAVARRARASRSNRVAWWRSAHCCPVIFANPCVPQEEFSRRRYRQCAAAPTFLRRMTDENAGKTLPRWIRAYRSSILLSIRRFRATRENGHCDTDGRVRRLTIRAKFPPRSAFRRFALRRMNDLLIRPRD